MNSEKLLIVGCGDIGRRLAAALPAPAYTVTGLRRRPPAPTDALTYIAGDARRESDLAQALIPGVDWVVVTPTPDGSGDEGYRRGYVESAGALVSALKAAPRAPRLLVWVSSTGVYGAAGDEDDWVDEQTPPEPTRDTARRLLEAEDVIRASGLPHCIVRPSGIYGPGRDRLQTLVRQGRATLSRAWTNRIHADDVAGAIAHLIQRQCRGEPVESLYVLSDCEPAPMAEVVAWLATQMGVDQACFAPDQGRTNKRCSNRRLLESGFRFRYPNYRAGYTALLAEY
ncbi:SDR family oxidoreductase [Marinimicrobium alkaliphilum]|uniref:SDR family oxidoreductase n=1 Tax=Marinimicrobium alkaliphilum TaxID=2202654 RepID=UPI001E4CE697|nr:SDR family oxidoreductase [Marinimicrobium alkaliphilum]